MTVPKNPTPPTPPTPGTDGAAQPQAAAASPTVPSTEQLAQSPNWGAGGRFVINSAGQRVPASASTTEQE